MPAEDQNIAMVQGDNKVLSITVTDAAGAAVDLTDATIRWHMSKSVNKRPAALEKATGSGITITDAANGVFTVTLDSADTESLRGLFYHEVEVIDGSGNVSTVTKGKITIHPALIKPEG